MHGADESDGFVTRLQRERCVRGWTQQEAIDRLKRLAYEHGDGHRFDGLDMNTLSRYEHGRIRRPRAPLRALFAALYQVPAAELFPSRTPIVAAPSERPGRAVWCSRLKNCAGSSPTPPCTLSRRACQCS